MASETADVDLYIDELLEEAGKMAAATATTSQQTTTVVEFGSDRKVYPMPIAFVTLSKEESCRLLIHGTCPADEKLRLRKRVTAITEGRRYILFVFGRLGSATKNLTESSGAGLLGECRKYGRGAERNASTRTFIVCTTLDMKELIPIGEKDPVVGALDERDDYE